MMKKSVLAVLVSGVVASSIYACPKADHAGTTTLHYQTSAERMVQADSARVLVDLDATVKSDDLATIKANAEKNLEKLIPDSQWQVVSYEQQKTRSGMVHAKMVFKARLGDEGVARLTRNLGSLNSSGTQYKIAGISYSPQLKDIEHAKKQLRSTILADINNQVEEINKNTGSHYKLKSVHFDTDGETMAVQPAVLAVKQQNNARAVNARALKVSQQLTMGADVTLAEQQGNN